MLFRSCILTLLIAAAATAYAEPVIAEPSFDGAPPGRTSNYYNPSEEEVPADSNLDDPNEKYYPAPEAADPAPYIKEAQQGQPPVDGEAVTNSEAPATAAPLEADPPPEQELPRWVETKQGKVKVLNKVFTRNKELSIKKSEEVKYGAISIKMEKCFRMPESLKEESSALLLIQQLSKSEPPKKLFHGWMFSSSPALSALEHPLYDVILLDCEDAPEKVEKKTDAKDEKKNTKDTKKTDAKPQTKKP